MRSLSSRDIRFSETVKLAWESGEGRTGRGVAVEAGAGCEGEAEGEPEPCLTEWALDEEDEDDDVR